MPQEPELNEAPKLPVHYENRRVLDLFPDEIVYPFGNALQADIETRAMFINPTWPVDAEDRNPQHFGNRIGLMRLYGPIEGGMRDGFIADLRYMKPGQIGKAALTVGESSDAFDKNFVKQGVDRKQNEPLLAALILDEDGNEKIIGDQGLESALDYLKNQVEAAKSGKTNAQETTSKDTNAPTVSIDEMPRLFELSDTDKE